MRLFPMRRHIKFKSTCIYTFCCKLWACLVCTTILLVAVLEERPQLATENKFSEACILKLPKQSATGGGGCPQIPRPPKSATTIQVSLFFCTIISSSWICLIGSCYTIILTLGDQTRGVQIIEGATLGGDNGDWRDPLYMYIHEGLYVKVKNGSILLSNSSRVSISICWYSKSYWAF